jgi:putative solute:sodium symporter small subunit
MQAPINIIPPYWRRTRRLTIALLASWFALTFGVLFFARELTSFHFFGWPFSFYMAAQGLTLLYVVILGIFSLCSHRIEQLAQHSSKDSS